MLFYCSTLYIILIIIVISYHSVFLLYCPIVLPVHILCCSIEKSLCPWILSLLHIIMLYYHIVILHCDNSNLVIVSSSFITSCSNIFILWYALHVAISIIAVMHYDIFLQYCYTEYMYYMSHSVISLLYYYIKTPLLHDNFCYAISL